MVLIYYVSIAGYGQVQPGKRLTFDNRVLGANRTESADAIHASESLSTSMTTTSQTVAHWKAKLLALMDMEKPYLEPELSLADLSRRMHTNPVLLSQVINVGAGKNFNEFVNEYRVAEFKQRVRDPANSHLSFLGIALDCGFNSKATFNRAFRKCTGLSPGQYAETQRSPGSMSVRASLGS